MRFSSLSKKERLLRKRKREREWHLKFAWFPTRINKKTIVWLERYARKDVCSLPYGGNIDINQKYEWNFKLTDDHLMDKLRGNE